MGFVGRNHIQILQVIVFFHPDLHIADDIIVLFLEYIGVDAVLRLSRLVILLVLGHFVNEEERQHLDALVEQFTLPLDMRKNRLPNLNPPQLIFADFTDHIPGIDLNAVQEFHGVVPAVNAGNDKIIFVFLHLPGIVVQVVPFRNLPGDFTNAGSTFKIKLNGRRGCRLGQVDTLQIDIALCSCAAGFRNALDRNLLHQPLVVRFHGIQAVDHVVDAVALMGGRIAESHQRMELRQILLRLLPLHGLGLIDDQNRIRLSDDIDRPAGAEFVQLHVDTAGILSSGIKGLGVDDHNIDGAVRCEAINFGQLGRVVDKKTDLFTILFRKMLLGHLERFIHTLADGDAGHHHDELAPAIGAVQLVHGLDVGVGLAHASLHLDSQVVMPLQLVRRFQLVGPLYLLQILQNVSVGELRHDFVVAPSGKSFILNHT